MGNVPEPLLIARLQGIICYISEDTFQDILRHQDQRIKYCHFKDLAGEEVNCPTEQIALHRSNLETRPIYRAIRDAIDAEEEKGENLF